jgi:hypothetical protein
VLALVEEREGGQRERRGRRKKGSETHVGALVGAERSRAGSSLVWESVLRVEVEVEVELEETEFEGGAEGGIVRFMNLSPSVPLLSDCFDMLTEY